MKSLTAILLTLSIACVCLNAHATINGKNVVLVHGFMPGTLANNPSDAELPALADEYWAEYWGSRAEAKLYWPSTERISGRIKDVIRRQVEALAANRTCAAGCVFVTHSAGDLVTRDLLTRLGQWGINRNDFRVLAVLDFAGAGGGSELADLANNVAQGSGIINAAQRAAVRAFAGIDVTPGNLGVLNDLRPAIARQTATQNSSVPRLRFAGSGSAFLGVTGPFLPGADDSVVSYHSSCGATRRAAFDSCSSSVRDNGVLASANAPSSLLFNHFPVLMGAGTNHSEVISNQRSGNYATVVNDRTLGGVRLDFATETRRRFRTGFRRARLLRGGDRRSMSANVFETLDR